MKKLLLGFFGGIIFIIGAIYKFMTYTEAIKMAFVQAWKAWFGYAVFGDEYYIKPKRGSYRPYNSYSDVNYETKRRYYKEN